mmetsp:Transcript_52219/g.124992  ORF Transcript_52219/g.124992 Transcript_52219/m.124992 type:complete len:387 (-) Transcript_52219:467-1627(-)
MAATNAAIMGRRLTAFGHHNLLVDVIAKEQASEGSRVSSKRHPAQETRTPGKVLAVWGHETEEADMFVPYFSSKPFNFDGDIVRLRHALGVVSHRGHKPDMPNQDEFFVLVQKESVLMGVFDGHGLDGHNVAHFAQEHLPRSILERLNAGQSWEPAVRSAVGTLNSECSQDEEMAQKAQLSGTTMTVLMLDSPSPSLWRIRCAHLGDSIAVLASRPKGGGAWQVTQLTEIHRADRQDESERITKAGGKVVHFEGEPPRLVADEWCLAVSRSWGDFHAAKCGLSCEPEFSVRDLPTDCECFVLICSDGVWDVMPQLQAVNLIGKYPPAEAQSAVEKLVSKAQLRWQEQGDVVDDITALVLWPTLGDALAKENADTDAPESGNSDSDA